MSDLWKTAIAQYDAVQMRIRQRAPIIVLDRDNGDRADVMLAGKEFADFIWSTEGEIAKSLLYAGRQLIIFAERMDTALNTVEAYFLDGEGVDRCIVSKESWLTFFQAGTIPESTKMKDSSLTAKDFVLAAMHPEYGMCHQPGEFMTWLRRRLDNIALHVTSGTGKPKSEQEVKENIE